MSEVEAERRKPEGTLNDIVAFAQHTIDKKAGDRDALEAAADEVAVALGEWPNSSQLQDARGDLATLLGGDAA